ncbi:hypothetical protein LUZ60_004854 [Juncus effusus]|nr:hypothetical protein LUZ60_004854 [Juncus effusus]
MAKSKPPKIKQEIPSIPSPSPLPPRPTPVIDLLDSDSDEDQQPPSPPKRFRVSNGESSSHAAKRKKVGELPVGFLVPLRPERDLERTQNPIVRQNEAELNLVAPVQGSKQFWKAGDFDESADTSFTQSTVAGLDHVRVHPKFLHSNATSHKWALGALAELLDNSLDEVANGATFVNIDMLESKKDGSRMLLVEDNGGGMDPDKMRQCMSLGYSAKSKIPSTIGQYGNGFKTSTMRLGADVIVFSRSSGKNGKRPTQSIGMLSYTFLKNTGKEDIVVPMLDYEKEKGWKKLARTNLADWNTNLETIIKWSPYSNEADLLDQFRTLNEHGTRIVIYNLWLDDQGQLELDFDEDPHDIQIRGANRDEKNIQRAKQFPNSKHYLTYRHSLRSYASILYLRLPHIFQMILRGKEIEHHNIVNDMMLKQDVTYRPQLTEGSQKDPNMVAAVTIGFVKDAKHHIDVQGFNVYHKNRLIKPFWRVWTAAGSGGRGVIGVLEANFIEPAHDKQDFERTTMLSRLESRLVQMQKNYWTNNSHRIGYCGVGSLSRRKNGDTESELNDGLPDISTPEALPSSSNKSGKSNAWKSFSGLNPRKSGNSNPRQINSDSSSDDSDPEYSRAAASIRQKSRVGIRPTLSPIQRAKRDVISRFSKSRFSPVGFGMSGNGGMETNGIGIGSRFKEPKGKGKENGSLHEDLESTVQKLKDENEVLQEKISEVEQKMSQELQIERDKNRNLTEQLEETQRKLEETSKEQEALIDIFSEERSRRDKDEEKLRNKLKDASATIEELVGKLSAARSGKQM